MSLAALAGAPGFGTVHVTPQLTQRMYNAKRVRITTFGSCPQRSQGWMTARRSRFSVIRVGFAMQEDLQMPANTLSG
jgi:hypothetical protein